MRIFELYFNPQQNEKSAEIFHHKPQDAYQRKLGRIYMIGYLPQVPQSNPSFLQNVFHYAKQKYYENNSFTPENALKEALKEVNRFLEEEKAKGLGEINLAFLASKNFSLYLAKMGGIEISLLTNGKVKNIGKELEGNSSGLFCNILSGKMKKDDKFLVVTPEIHHFFARGKIPEKLSSETLEESTIEEVSSLQKEKFPHVHGVALIMDHSPSLKERTKLISQEKKERFSFSCIFQQFEKVKKRFCEICRLLISRRKKIPRLEKKTFKKTISLPKNLIRIDGKSVNKRPLVLLAVFLAIILLGALAVGIENSFRASRQQERLETIEEKIITGETEENILLLIEAFYELDELRKERGPLKKEAENMRSLLSENLLALSGYVALEEPELFYTAKEINPERIILAEEKLFLLSSHTPRAIIIDTNTMQKSLREFSLEKGITLASSFAGKAMLFSDPNFLLKEKDGFIPWAINLPPEEAKYVALSSYLHRPYFLEKNGDIIVYRNDLPEKWLSQKEERITGGIDLAIDGSIFVLTAENEIKRYYKGELEEKITPILFPTLESANKIYTSQNIPLFLLDSEEKRIIVLSKEGEVKQQLHSAKIKNLKDIAVTEDGKKIYLLDGQKVYLIDLSL